MPLGYVIPSLDNINTNHNSPLYIIAGRTASISLSEQTQ